MAQIRPLHTYLREAYSFTEKETSLFVSHFEKRKVKKKQFVIQPDFVAKHRIYVVKGAFRAYVIGENGQEHTISLAIESWWINDPISYLKQLPATMFVEALEDSIIMQLNYENELLLKANNHTFETFFRIAAERGFAFTYRRLTSTLTHTAQERYEDGTQP